MRVTKAQAQANRARIVETASTLFRERGYDGVGVADLMAAAGFTHGGFYKHFRSKAELMAEAAASGLSQSLASSEGLDAAEFFKRYSSREHRDAPQRGLHDGGSLRGRYASIRGRQGDLRGGDRKHAGNP